MNNRLRLVLVLGTLILFGLTMAACSRERPAPTANNGTPAARGTVAAVGPAITQVALPDDAGSGAGAAPTPSAPSAQQVVANPAASTATGSGQSYTVVAGDTLLNIATRFGTTTEALARLNSLPDPNVLTLGQKLLIPGKGATTGTSQGTGSTTTGGTTATGGSTIYTVQQGDSVGSIAKRFGTTVQEIVRLNSLTNPDKLSVGQKLTVPGGGGGAAAAPTVGSGKSYVIQRGDTLLSIARQFGLTVKQLQDANNIANPDRIYPGQKVIIP